LEIDKCFNSYAINTLDIKEAGPKIFVQSHPLIFPSGSLEASSEMLSVGKVITWSGPAIEIGGLLASLQSSQEISF
jgi:hypothetical protein